MPGVERTGKIGRTFAHRFRGKPSRVRRGVLLGWPTLTNLRPGDTFEKKESGDFAETHLLSSHFVVFLRTRLRRSQLLAIERSSVRVLSSDAKVLVMNGADPVDGCAGALRFAG